MSPEICFTSKTSNCAEQEQPEEQEIKCTWPRFRLSHGAQRQRNGARQKGGLAHFWGSLWKTFISNLYTLIGN